MKELARQLLDSDMRLTTLKSELADMRRMNQTLRQRLSSEMEKRQIESVSIDGAVIVMTDYELSAIEIHYPTKLDDDNEQAVKRRRVFPYGH